MAREDLHFRLRIPEALKKRVEAAAADNHRSMTAEIITRLERSFDEDDHYRAMQFQAGPTSEEPPPHDEIPQNLLERESLEQSRRQLSEMRGMLDWLVKVAAAYLDTQEKALDADERGVSKPPGQRESG